MARPSHKPDAASRRYVESMAGFGIPEADIGDMVGVDPKTLRKHYRLELKHGHTKANARVAENLYRRATGEGREAVTAAIFWLKTRAGWRETLSHEVSGRDGMPIEVVEHRPRELAKAILAILSRAQLEPSPAAVTRQLPDSTSFAGDGGVLP
jgi:hypothetical protein